MEMHINMVAVLVTVAANFMLGFIWYRPLFGKVWAKEMGFDTSIKPKTGEMTRGMIFMVVGNFFWRIFLLITLRRGTLCPG